ncbi:AraC family ligand binding domain-containing protein [Streptomyces sp. NBC_00503]|uniref:AraC family ligand binding domain-containing protein n=1 Tax=Streptomyces sp. NBC_00503 TaxID=2903659 RepID=UPI002E80987A|nr:AraC family ligand binding domain-containing protein [Streptomyces sp. NBC_00503]WUD79178.1 AraC family ligand binding domain-containing protein [Streptomyces sp. NBC_00503]
MNVSSSTLSLTVADVDASRAFLCTHLGYEVAMADDGFVSPRREDAAIDVVLPRGGTDVLPPEQRDQRAAGLIPHHLPERRHGRLGGPQPRQHRTQHLDGHDGGRRHRPEHSISRAQVWTVTAGTLEVTCRGRTVKVAAGRTLILPAGRLRRIRSLERAEAQVSMPADGVASVPGTEGTLNCPGRGDSRDTIDHSHCPSPVSSGG